jgi:hypothetical protein
MSEDKKGFCSFCEFRTTKLTQIGSKSYCLICRLTLKPTTHDTHKIIAAYSIQQQIMINKLSREFILKNNRIPTPHEIDPNCRLIDINPTVIHQIVNLMSQISSDDASCFLNIKYFLSDDVEVSDIKTVNFFKVNENKVNNKTYDRITRIPLLKHQKNLFSKYYQKFIDNNDLKIKNLFKS